MGAYTQGIKRDFREGFFPYHFGATLPHVYLILRDVPDW